MNQESEIFLQSYLDAELSERDARRARSLIAEDSNARALVAELRATKEVVRANQPEPKLPESREFYWSKIQREIQRLDVTEVKPHSGFLWRLRRLLAPLAGVALVVLLALSTLKTGVEDSAGHLAEVENLSEHTGAYSFRSHAEKMFVVWVYDRNQEAAPDPELEEDLIIQ